MSWSQAFSTHRMYYFNSEHRFQLPRLNTDFYYLGFGVKKTKSMSASLRCNVYVCMQGGVHLGAHGAQLSIDCYMIFFQDKKNFEENWQK